MSSSVVSASPSQNISPFTNVVHAVQFIRKMRGGSQPALIRCSDEKLYVVKFLDNQQGPNVLANEVLGNELLNSFGLPTPEWKAVFISNRFVKENSEMSQETPAGSLLVKSGLHFGSEFLGDKKTGQVYEWLPSGFYSRLINPEDLLGIHLFDVWANHCDHRQSLFTTEDGNSSIRAVFIDNGHLFGGPEWKLKSRQGESLGLDARLHRHEWPTEAVDRWVSLFETKCSISLYDVIRRVPRFWYTGDIHQVVESSAYRLRLLRDLFLEELIRKRRTSKPNHVDPTDARLPLRRSELPFHGNFKDRPPTCLAS
jgi:hypothetical protein